MSPDVLDRIAAVVRRRTGNGESFTAFDVTTEVRGDGIFLKHGEARDAIHSMFSRGEFGSAYRRTVVDLGSGAKPMVYHRADVDPRTYRSSASGATPQTPSIPAPSASPGLVQRITDFFTGRSADSAATDRRPTIGRRGSGTPVIIDLDAGPFQPISRDELLRKTRGFSLFANVWFGRRDLIPPSSDRRTMLIDRAMISSGLITAAEVARMHQIGDLYAKYSGQIATINAQAAAVGDAAVAQDRERRKQIKQAKKAEAQRKKAERRAAIEHRKNTDITFLGRTVSSRLNDLESDFELLKRTDLPLMSSPADLAAAMQCDVSNLRFLAFHNEAATRVNYVNFTVPKKSGGVRQLSAPHRRLFDAQRWILDSVLCKVQYHDAAHGFVPGRSIVTGARPHVGSSFVINVDLENFFPAIHWTRVRKVFTRLGYSGSVATVMALICTEPPRREVRYNGVRYHVATGPRGLPQGACTSPSLSNAVAVRLDRRLAGLANRMNLRYTRYADDITLSSGDDSMGSRIGYLLSRLRHICGDEGFRINPKKTRVQRRHQCQSVTGLVVNDKVSVSRKELRRLRSILHHASTEGLASQNRINHPNFHGYMTGMIAHVASVRPDLANDMQKQLDNCPA